MTERGPMTADELRAMGIDHPLVSDDDELVALVSFLRSVGVETPDMIGADLSTLAGPLLIRPGAMAGRTVTGAGVDPDFAIRMARALGFGPQDTLDGLTPEEVETIVYFDSLRPLLGEDELLGVMRTVGSSMSRIARSLVSTLRVRYETPILDETGSLLEVTQAYSALVEDSLPHFLSAVSTILRRHLATITAQPSPWVVDDRGTTTLENLTVGFVDIVGFTAFTERADAREFIEALTAFEAQVNEAVVGNGGTLVKLLGDEAMFVAPTASAGITIARRLAQLPLSEPGPSSVRIGLSSGQVVAIGGDYYGTVVNVASRIQRLADPDCILVTAEVANGAHASARFEPIGPHDLRGIAEPVEIFRLCE